MTRGRRPIPDQIKALKGNPGKRRLHLPKTGSTPPKPLKSEPPPYLTDEREREIFRIVLETLPGNLARNSDVHAIARWCTWMNIWVTAKLELDGKEHFYESESKHGKFLREHPLSKTLEKAEVRLIALEDRLCLNIVARNNVVNRLFSMPPPPPDQPEPETTKKGRKKADALPASPLDYLSIASGKPN